jgi:hypothetical protein
LLDAWPIGRNAAQDSVCQTPFGALGFPNLESDLRNREVQPAGNGGFHSLAFQAPAKYCTPNRTSRIGLSRRSPLHRQFLLYAFPIFAQAIYFFIQVKNTSLYIKFCSSRTILTSISYLIRKYVRSRLPPSAPFEKH